MPQGPSVLFGCLPVWIVVSAGGNTYDDYWEEVEEVYWLKRNGTKGSPVKQSILDRAEAQDFGFCNVLESFWDNWRCAKDEEEERLRNLGPYTPQDYLDQVQNQKGKDTLWTDEMPSFGSP